VSLNFLDPRTPLCRAVLFGAALSAAALALIVFATPISKTHSTLAVVNDGHGKEWMQLPATAGLTWSQTAQACPQDGVTACAGSVAGRNINDWVWATDSQVLQLFSYFESTMPPDRSVEGLAYFGSAQSFLSAFQPTQELCLTYLCGAFGAGWTASKDDVDPRMPIVGSVSWRTTSVSASGSFGVGPTASADEAQNDRGVWLWRATGPGAHAYDDEGQVASPAGGVAVANVLANDWIADHPATTAIVTIEQLSSTDAGVTLDPSDGSVDVAAGTPAASYTLIYRMCDRTDSLNCDDATVIVVVNPYVVNAVGDSGWASPSTGGAAIENVLANDTLSGAPATLANVSLSPVLPAVDGVTLDVASGSVNVARGTALGPYALVYEICDLTDPSNCARATASIEVKNYVIDAVNDSVTASSKTGGTVIPSVLANDTLNAARATAATVQLSQASPAVQGITLNLSTGAVSVAPKTASGLYNLVYRICEIASLTNCDTATITLDLFGSGGGSGSGSGGGSGGTTALPTATPVVGGVATAGGTTALPPATPTALPTATAVSGGGGTTALPDVQVSGSASTGSPAPGTQFSYTFKVKNSGAVGSTEVTLTDLLPAQLPPSSYVTATTSDGSVCAALSPDGGATLNLTCGLGALAAGVEKTVTIVVTAPSAPTTIVNTATATSSNGDANSTNNSRSITVTVK